MDEGTDVDRMLARLGENNIHYREFGHTVAAPVAPWDPEDKSRRLTPASEPAVVPTGTWNSSQVPAARLTTEPLLIDPEAPGGRLAAIPSAQQSGIPTPDAIADGRTPPAPVDRAYSPPSAPLSRVTAQAPSPLPLSAVPPSPGTLDGLFKRVSGHEQPPAAQPSAAPLSALFKRLS